MSVKVRFTDESNLDHDNNATSTMSASEGDSDDCSNDTSTMSASEGDNNDSVTPNLEGDNNTMSDNSSSTFDAVSNERQHNIDSLDSDGSVAQRRSRSGRISMRPKHLMKNAFLGLLSHQIGSQTIVHQKSPHGTFVFKA